MPACYGHFINIYWIINKWVLTSKLISECESCSEYISNFSNRSLRAKFFPKFFHSVSGILECDSSGTIAGLLLWEICHKFSTSKFLGLGKWELQEALYWHGIWAIHCLRLITHLEGFFEVKWNNINRLFAIKPLLSPTYNMYVGYYQVPACQKLPRVKRYTMRFMVRDLHTGYFPWTESRFL